VKQYIVSCDDVAPLYTVVQTAKADQAAETDMHSEYARQREHLERSVASLRKKLAKDTEIHRADTIRVMQVWHWPRSQTRPAHVWHILLRLDGCVTCTYIMAVVFMIITVHTHMHTHTHTHMHTRTHAHTHACTHTQTLYHTIIGERLPAERDQ